MPEESSHREDITENTPIDLGATTEEAYRISRRSRSLARSVLGDTGFEDRIRQRCSIAVGDFGMAGLLEFRNQPVDAGLSALGRGVWIITDIRMVQAGILRKGHRSPVLCSLEYGEEIALERKITRTSAGILALREKIPGSLVVIGNAPSALLTLCQLAVEGIRPALVIGTPVGFVNAAESKEILRGLDLPSISTRGTRGGTPVAVAAMNELITLHAERNGGM